MKNLNDTIIGFWNNFLDFGQLPERGESKVIIHNKNNIPENELYILEFLKAGRVVSVHEKYFKDIASHILNQGFDTGKVKKKFESITGREARIQGPIISMYLFSEDKLKPTDPETKELTAEEKPIFDNFIESCKDQEMKEVDMDFDDPTHRFFVLHRDNEIVSMCNYSINEPTGIAHIGIVTPKRFSGKGYGKTLVNSVVRNILENHLIPQYRVHKENLVSQKIAKGLGFEPVVEGFSIIV